MSKESLPIGVIPIIVITWIISLVTTLAIVYVAPNIFPISVETDNIVDSAIITSKLADGNVTSAKILDGSLTAVDIADGSLVTVKVADGAVTTDKISDGAVTTAKMEDGVITTAKIADGALVAIKLADGSVTSAKILDGAVTAVDLADNSIVTVKIADGAVTTEKIVDGAVTTSKIAEGNVTNIKLAAGAIPHNVTYSAGSHFTSSTSFIDIPEVSVDITLTRNSTLVIMFSAETWLTGTGTYDIYWRAMVNTTPAYPDSDFLIITKSTDYGSHSYTFYMPNVVAGTYTVKMQWRVFQATTTGEINERTLTVIALPD